MPRRTLLLDTGPLVAFLDADDQWHSACVEIWRARAHQCVTTEAVVTEACHLIGRGRANAARPLEVLLAAEIPILGLAHELHEYAVHLMYRYADLPMDYADATLVAVGDALGIRDVLTTDRKGFRAYRASRQTAFRVFP